MGETNEYFEARNKKLEEVVEPPKEPEKKPEVKLPLVHKAALEKIIELLDPGMIEEKEDGPPYEDLVRTRVKEARELALESLSAPPREKFYAVRLKTSPILGAAIQWAVFEGDWNEKGEPVCGTPLGEGRTHGLKETREKVRRVIMGGVKVIEVTDPGEKR